jgi:hypothetical protein
MFDASRRKQPVPTLAKWSLGLGIAATIGANVAHGLSHGAIGALVSAWPARALVGSFELLMTLTRSAATPAQVRPDSEAVRVVSEEERPERAEVEQTPEESVLADYLASLDGPGKPLSQRFLAEKHGVDRRRVREIISTVAQPEPA